MRAQVAWKFRWCRIPGTKKAKNNGARNDGIAAAKIKTVGKRGAEVRRKCECKPAVWP